MHAWITHSTHARPHTPAPARPHTPQDLTPVTPYVQDYILQHASKEERYHGAFRRHLTQSGVPVEYSKGEAGCGQV